MSGQIGKMSDQKEHLKGHIISSTACIKKKKHFHSLMPASVFYIKNWLFPVVNLVTL